MRRHNGPTEQRMGGQTDRRTDGRTDRPSQRRFLASKNLQFKTKQGCVALTVWLQRLIKDASYFQKSVVFQRFCKIAFWFSFTLFGTASKQIQLQKPDWTTFEAHLVFLNSKEIMCLKRGKKCILFSSKQYHPLRLLY